MKDDDQHLQLLTIGHYVLAAITALSACIPLIHVTIGVVFLVHPPKMPATGNAPPFPAELVGWMFVVMGSMFVLIGWLLAACLYMAGRSISARKRYTFCFVIAALSCPFFPFGTVLGVFTIVVLSRPSVKAIFQKQAGLDAWSSDMPQPGAGKKLLY